MCRYKICAGVKYVPVQGIYCTKSIALHNQIKSIVYSHSHQSDARTMLSYLTLKPKFLIDDPELSTGNGGFCRMDRDFVECKG